MLESFEWRRVALQTLTDVCRELNAELSVSNLRPDGPLMQSLSLDGVDFTLLHCTDTHRDELLVECELGTAPEDTAVLEDLLEQNLSLMRTAQGSLGWRRESNQITFSTLVQPRSMDAAKIIEIMRALAEQAHSWREGEASGLSGCLGIIQDPDGFL